MSGRVGFVGLGVMGAPMARNLLTAGVELMVCSRTPAPVDAIAAEGAVRAETPAELAAQCQTIITMLPTSASVLEVTLGPSGLFSTAQAGTLLIDMSTIDPHVSRTLEREGTPRGISVLDAPVSGGDIGARNGTLAIMVGGAPADFERARPLLEILGSTIVHVGPSGAGQTVKACNQIVVGITYAAVSEALVLGSKSGVAPDLILDVLSSGLAANRIMEVRRSNLLEHNFTPGFRVDLHHKDLAIALEAGDQANVPLPFAALTQQMLGALRARGRGNQDHSALLTVTEELAQHEIGSPTASVPS